MQKTKTIKIVDVLGRECAFKSDSDMVYKKIIEALDDEIATRVCFEGLNYVDRDFLYKVFGQIYDNYTEEFLFNYLSFNSRHGIREEIFKIKEKARKVCMGKAKEYVDEKGKNLSLDVFRKFNKKVVEDFIITLKKLEKKSIEKMLEDGDWPDISDMVTMGFNYKKDSNFSHAFYRLCGKSKLPDELLTFAFEYGYSMEDDPNE